MHEFITNKPLVAGAALALGATLLAGCESSSAATPPSSTTGSSSSSQEGSSQSPDSIPFHKPKPLAENFSSQTEQGQLDAINASLIPEISAYAWDLINHSSEMDKVPTDGISSTSDSTLVEGIKQDVAAELAKHPGVYIAPVACPDSTESYDPAKFGCDIENVSTILPDTSKYPRLPSQLKIEFSANTSKTSSDMTKDVVVIDLGHDYKLVQNPETNVLQFTPNS